MKREEGCLHDCSELPPQGPILDNETNKLSWLLHRDQNAVRFIRNRFAASTGTAGKGTFGAVVTLNDVLIPGNSTTAVKIIPFKIEDSELYEPAIVQRDVQQELFIACQVNSLREYTSAFIQTHGWLISQRIPEDWKLFVDMKKVQYGDATTQTYMFLFMEHAIYEFKSKKVAFHLEGYLTILFILLHALYIGQQKLGFTHGDLHMGNIMIDVVHGNTVDLTVDKDITFTVDLYNRYMPKIIDFGFSKTTLAQDGGRRKNDVASLFGAISTRAEKYDLHNQDLSLITNFEDFDMPLYDLLVKHPMFDSIRKVKNFKRQRLFAEKCVVCGSEAKLQFETNANYKFCHEYCANKIKGIAMLL